MKLTKLTFPYCNLADLGEKFGIKIPEPGKKFDHLNNAMREVLLHTDEANNSEPGKMNWANPLGLENTEAQKVEAFQACIRVLMKGEKTSENEILKAALKKAHKSIGITDTKIPANAKPDEIKETLKKTIEAVVDSLSGHEAGFFSKPGKSGAIKELARLTRLANGDEPNPADAIRKLKASIITMGEFKDDKAKYKDYQSNLSVLNSLVSSIEHHNPAQEESLASAIQQRNSVKEVGFSLPKIAEEPARVARNPLRASGPETEESSRSPKLPAIKTKINYPRSLTEQTVPSPNQENTPPNGQALGLHLKKVVSGGKGGGLSQVARLNKAREGAKTNPDVSR